MVEFSESVIFLFACFDEKVYAHALHDVENILIFTAVGRYFFIFWNSRAGR